MAFRRRRASIWRPFHHGVVVASLVLLIALSARFSAAQVDTDDEIRRCIQEARAGGPLPIRDSSQVPWHGARWVVDPREVYSCAVRRALERVAGVDLSDAGRNEIIDSHIDKWRRAGVPPDELSYYQLIAPAFLVGWSGRYSRPLPTPGVAGASVGPDGQVLQAATDQTGDTRGFAGWQGFMEDVIPITSHLYGRTALFLNALAAKQQTVEDAVRTALSGRTLPEFFDERTPRPAPTPAVGGAATERDGRVLQAAFPPSPPQNLNLIYRPASSTQQTLDLVQSAPLGAILSNPFPLNTVAFSSPDEQIPSLLSGSDQQQGVRSVAFGTGEPHQTAGGLGRANELAGIAPQGTPFSQALVQNAVLEAALARAAADAQRRLDALAAASRFFPPSAPETGNLFPPNEFADRIGNLFGGGAPGGGGGAGGGTGGGGAGGGGGGLPTNLNDLPSQTVPPAEEACTGQQPRITAAEAKAIAVLLGLPPSRSAATPWQIFYTTAQSLYGIRGTNAETFRDETIGPEHFSPPESCVWSVLAQTQGENVQRLVLVEDVRSPASRKIHLTVPRP